MTTTTTAAAQTGKSVQDLLGDRKFIAYDGKLFYWSGPAFTNPVIGRYGFTFNQLIERMVTADPALVVRLERFAQPGALAAAKAMQFKNAKMAGTAPASLKTAPAAVAPTTGPRWLGHDGTRFTWSGPEPTHANMLKRGFVRLWKVLGTRDPRVAASVRQFADAKAEAEFTRVEAELAARRLEVAEGIRLSMATDADIDIPAPEGRAYLPFQKAAVAFWRWLKERGATTILLGDEPGLGKTIEAIAIMNDEAAHGKSMRSGLIVCPVTLKINWQRELAKWLLTAQGDNPVSIGIAEGDHFPDTDFVIINYDILERHQEALRDRHWDVLAVDEGHYLANEDTNRTRQVAGFDGDAKAKAEAIAPLTADITIGITGTPLTSRPRNLFSLLRFLRPARWNDFFKYAQKFCGAFQQTIAIKGIERKIWNFDGASNLEELQAELRSTLMVRRRKAAVLKDLPPKLRQIVELQATGRDDLAAVAGELKVEQAHDLTVDRLFDVAEKVRANVAEIVGHGDDIDPAAWDRAYREAVKRLPEADRLAFEEIARARKETALAKLPAAIEHIRMRLLEEDKVIVFAHHKEVIDGLRRAFNNAVVVDGRTSSAKKRQEAVDAFQEDPDVNLFIGSITACAAGLTLTAASRVICVELDPVPANMSQAEDRAHRIGAKDTVWVEHLVMAGSIDVRIAELLIEKQEVIDATLNATEEDVDEMAAALVAAL